jgi:tetratricopeptide (TPR) repeat protein
VLLDDFLIEYWVREETLESLWRWIESQEKGHLTVTGEVGSGKSWLLRGLAVNAQPRGFIPILADRLKHESFETFLYKMIDHTEFLLDLDAESLKQQVNFALYRSGKKEAWQAYINWLGREVPGRYIIMLDDMPFVTEISVFPHNDDLPEGIYVITTAVTKPAMSHSQQFDLDQRAHLSTRELRGYLRNRLTEVSTPKTEEILKASKANWRLAYHYTHLMHLHNYDANLVLPEKDGLFDAVLGAIGDKVGKENFRNVHLDILILLAVAQVPVHVELLQLWGVPKEQLGFALFDLRGLLTNDGEASQMDALAGGEHYSIACPWLKDYILSQSGWRDRVGEAHRRVCQPALDLNGARWARSTGREDEYYALCFAPYHLDVSGRKADLARLNDPIYAERCWAFSRLARENSYDEIALNLLTLAATKIRDAGTAESARQKAMQAEVQAELCNLLTQIGRYAEAAKWGENAVTLGQGFALETQGQARALWIHCILSLADPYLFMGLVEPAEQLFSEALRLSETEQRVEKNRAIHAVRGLARVARSNGHFNESLQHGLKAMEHARSLIQEEGEEWANYLFDLLVEQADCLRSLSEDQETKPGSLEVMTWRWEAIRYLREASELYQKNDWPPDSELATVCMEESMILFELERWAEAEKCLSHAISIYKSLPEVHPGEFASLEYLRSQALALMNRIGEASGSLNQLVNSDLLDSLDVSERALVLFFQAKVFTHQGYLREATQAMSDAIQCYQDAIAEGNEDLDLELVSSRAYLARVLTRRGRFELVRRVLSTGFEQLVDIESEDSLDGLLEKADLLDVQALVHYHKGELPWALQRCNESLQLLEQVEASESEPDLETERSGLLATRSQILAAQGDFEAALRDCDRSLEIESHRAQEGYETSNMWRALHLSTKASIHRLSGDWQKGLEVAQAAVEQIQKLPNNQQAHLGASLARMHFEIGQCQAAGDRLEDCLKSLSCSAGLLESEMLQGKTHLVSQLIEVYTHWLEVQKKLSLDEENNLIQRWSRFFDSWSSWENFLEQESRSDFLKKSVEELRTWAAALTGSSQSVWSKQAPLMLKEKRRRPHPSEETSGEPSGEPV